jgi:glyoxylase-like metal-dependent hydrolase (beta-lactamase superfamily II)
VKRHQSEWDRREFVGASASCAAYLCGLGAVAPKLIRSRFAPSPGRAVQQEAWGTLESVADDVWALISTPLEDRTTLCNGGLIAGRDAVLAVEAYATARGAEWIGERSRALTGRWPDHVLVTHFHGDHSSGVAGFRAGGERPEIHATAVTRDRVLETDRAREGGPDPDRTAALMDVRLLSDQAPTSIDLGGRVVHLIPRAGHTPSDVTVELDDPSVVFCGDLMWNGMFPNYVDAIPSVLSRDVRALRRSRDTLYVPGHGRLGNDADFGTYIGVLDAVEAAARRAVEQGVTADEAAKTFTLPSSLGEWFMFSPQYYARALGAWERELQHTGGAP